MSQNWPSLLVVTDKLGLTFIFYYVDFFKQRRLLKAFYNYFLNKFFSVFFAINAALIYFQSLLFSFLWFFSNLELEKQEPKLFKACKENASWILSIWHGPSALFRCCTKWNSDLPKFVSFLEPQIWIYLEIGLLLMKLVKMRLYKRREHS